MSYRCPTCTTQYRATEQTPPSGYVRCRVCGFLIDVAANRIGEVALRAETAPAAGAPRWPILVAVLVLVLALAWVVTIAEHALAL